LRWPIGRRGGGRGEGDFGLGGGDADDVARGVGVRGVAVVGGAIEISAHGRLVVAELVGTVRVGHVRRDVVPRGGVGGVLEGDGGACDWGVVGGL